MKKNKETAKQLFVGEVVSDKMDKSIVVKVLRTYKDSRFHKILHRTKKYKVHDEHRQAKAGDIVEFREGRPLSKSKYMHLTRVIETDSITPISN